MDKKNLVIRTISGAILVAVIVACILINQITLGLLFAVLAVLTTMEYITLVNKKGTNLSPDVAGLLSAAITLCGVTAHWMYFFERTSIVEKIDVSSISLAIFCVLILLYILGCIVWLISDLWSKSEEHQRRRHAMFMSQIYTTAPFCWLMVLGLNHPWFALLVFIFIWTNDTFAYLGGSLFGKHKMAPTISPKKSWEGFVCGIIVTLLVAVGISFIPYIQNQFTQFSAMSTRLYIKLPIWALFIVLAGTAGDLMESSLKREIGVKDSGKLIPGHGGMLDRFDSILFAAPVAALILLIFFI